MAAVLLDFGTRIQESVFVAHLDEELAGRMKERLAGTVDLSWDKVHVFELCAGCEKRTTVIGQGELVNDPAWHIV